MLTKKEFPPTWPYSIKGNGKHWGPTAQALKRAMKRGGYGFKDKTFAQLTGEFNQKLENALDKWDPGKNGYGQGRYNKIRNAKKPNGQYLLDAYAQNLVRVEYAASQLPPAPKLGPMFHGGKSVLLHDLTHATYDLPLYPAFDDAFGQGVDVTAPERVRVYEQSSSTPGHAFYALGVGSKIRYWFGHLDRTPPVGRIFSKGQVMGKTIRNTSGGGPHAHVGMNVELLWGAGKQMTHNRHYLHGAPLIGAQLKAGHAL